MWSFMSPFQIVALIAIHRAGFRVLYRFGYGPLGKIGFLLSPGLAWAVPFYLGLLLRLCCITAKRQDNEPTALAEDKSD